MPKFDFPQGKDLKSSAFPLFSAMRSIPFEGVFSKWAWALGIKGFKYKDPEEPFWNAGLGGFSSYLMTVAFPAVITQKSTTYFIHKYSINFPPSLPSPWSNKCSLSTLQYASYYHILGREDTALTTVTTRPGIIQVYVSCPVKFLPK